MTEATKTVPFDHINLNEVDPQAQTPPNGVPMDFQITEAVIKTYDNTEKGGGAGYYINLKFTVVNSDTFSGRNYYSSLFPDKEGSKMGTQRRLRILMDNTGIPQTGTIEEFLAALVQQRATFSAPLQDSKQKDGSLRQEVNMGRVSPVS